MKTVFENSMVAHVWFQQKQDSGRSHNGNLYFDGPTIYSYGPHFPLAHILTNAKGAKAVLRNADSRSQSTSGHQWDVVRAVSDDTLTIALASFDKHSAANLLRDVRYYDCDGYKSGGKRKLDKESAKRVWNRLKPFLAARMAHYVSEASRPRLAAKVSHNLEYAAGIAYDARKLAAFLGIKAKRELKGFTESDVAAINEKFAPIIERKRQREAELDATRHEREAKAKEKQERINAEIRSEAQAFPDAWRNGEDSIAVKIQGVQEITIYRGQWHNLGGDTLLRIKPNDPETIETSLGATFPKTHALRAWPVLKAIKESGKAWHTNGHKIPLGHFQIDSVSEAGDIKAGCHTLKWNEVARMAETLGVA